MIKFTNLNKKVNNNFSIITFLLFQRIEMFKKVKFDQNCIWFSIALTGSIVSLFKPKLK